MSYSNGAISNVSAGSAFISVIDAVLTAAPGITKVDAALVAGTITWNVYKSAAGTNVAGIDFYFALGYPTVANNSICMTIFEGYNNATHQALSYPPNIANNTPVANFANPGPAIALPSTGAMGYVQSANLPGNFTYAFSVTANRVQMGFFATTTGMNDGFYLGLYDPVMSTADDPFPLCCVNLTKQVITAVQPGSTPIAQSGLCTREPKTLVSSSINFACAGGASGGAWTYTGGNGQVDTYLGWYYVNRVGIFGRGNGFRGLLKDTFFGPTQTNNGDQLQWTLNSVNYVGTRFTSSGYYMLNV